MADYFFVPVGEQSLNLIFPNLIDVKQNQLIQHIARYLLRPDTDPPGIVDVIPAYHTLTVNFDPALLQADELQDYLDRLIQSKKLEASAPVKHVLLLPVCYDEEFGPDLNSVAAYGHMTVPELIDLHSSLDYFVYMLGFLPGFAYMGTVPDRIAMPRLDQPRAVTAAGSVGIAGQQTGMYPLQSPGGWRLLGRTPVRLYDPKRPAPLYEAGDYIRFQAISRADYNKIRQLDQAGKFQLAQRNEADS
ncbi:5-oxoprolinase subunit PxpB [Oenococcus kitaharae]|uniref:Allophanate hydrolase 2 subunit 1 n=1 Tax=Oenococcus kitaharae DSM 17330 TaxID=1045004 RepID=G9WFM2_9LACO|nr:5-oxoprolinase subunit PxpB [Oenococcus kitaharae]EHN59314.1 Allophanate hydrolase 2 subunit 1 [Oenococcus kitaharae DSM 17330]OEY82166.1 allophanate hydrolase [Oenococcus kitaharae]OEY82589.1 allophanate hydrolase [Oenococcus kitaharae]OEY84845.1 allophanate hydrolase [Oenococcus kitaharae]